MNDQPRLYNSRIIKIYLDYLSIHNPDIDKEVILANAGMEKHEVDDPAHWFTQEQVDDFHAMISRETKNPDIARAAGRFGAMSTELGPLRQYVLGLINPVTMYLFMEKVYPFVSKGAILKSKKLAHNKVEVTSVPVPEAVEKPFQCDNRIGFLEAIVQVFMKTEISVDQPECYHRGDQKCRYIVSWTPPNNYKLRRARDILSLISIVGLGISFFLLPIQTWLIATLFSISTISIISHYSQRIENKDLEANIKRQGISARDHLQEIHNRYNNALLFQKVAHSTASLGSIDGMLSHCMDLMSKHLNFKKGLIFLSDENDSILKYKAGFGFQDRNPEELKATQLSLKGNQTPTPFAEVFLQKESIVRNRPESNQKIHEESNSIYNENETVGSAVFTPIVFENRSIGVMVVSHETADTNITESDINLLKGIAAQIAIGVTNARSFENLKESEKKYRTLIETTDTGYFIVDRAGCVIDANAEYVRLSGHQTLDQIVSRKVIEWTNEDDIEIFNLALRSCFKDGNVRQLELRYVDSTGKITPIEINGSVVEVKNEEYVLIICRDITKQKQAQELMIQNEKMVTVRGLAAGMAHEINNPLAGIMQTMQVLKNRLSSKSEKYQEIASECGTSIDAIEAFHQKIKTFPKVDGILEAGRRAALIVENMINFSQQDEQQFKLHDIVKLLDRSVEMAKSDYDLKTNYDFRLININRQYDKKVPRVPCAGSKIQQVFLNILKNGAHEMFGIQKVANDPTFTLRILSEKNHVRIEIIDNGPGMKVEVQKRIFEPFYTTKEVGEGTGLGLSIAYFIIKENHGGDLMVDSTPGKGTKFVILLPLDSGKM